MTSVEISDEQKTAAAVQAFLDSLAPNQADAILALPPEKQLDALLRLAEQINANPWPTPTEMTGERNPLDVIDWSAPSHQSSSSRPG